MELMTKILEQSAVFSILCATLYFLGKYIIPRWLKSMDDLQQALHTHARIDAIAHQSIILTMTEFSSRLLFHEAKVVPGLQGTTDDQVAALNESFERSVKGNEALRQDIKDAFALIIERRNAPRSTSPADAGSV